ncbi:unnamed protein product [Arabis nemorensis]|uniref:Uncharacterized protein n=1 Tax=Arabis nemorensis TaxID=586526 RepID=A0A565AWJ4_9BRAS|nr:unnamed protein product [Arabis nemorensis]
MEKRSALVASEKAAEELRLASPITAALVLDSSKKKRERMKDSSAGQASKESRGEGLSLTAEEPEVESGDAAQ